MKKITIIFIISITLILIGILYGSRVHPIQEETAMLQEAYTAQFPETMPEVVMDPMVGFPVY